MNCELCKKELDTYLEGKLPEGIRIQVKDHLDNCNDCAEIFDLMSLANRVIDEEKDLLSNPFLSIRVMSEIEKLELQRESCQHIPVYLKVLKPVLIVVSVAAAVFIGVMAGNLYTTATLMDKIPLELSYMNDATLESVELFANQN